MEIPYFLEILPHLEIPPPSKSRHTYKEVGSNKRRPRNLAAWKRIVGIKVRGMQVHASDSHYRKQASGLVAALEISPPLKSRRRVQRLKIKSHRGEISRKYGASSLDVARYF